MPGQKVEYEWDGLGLVLSEDEAGSWCYRRLSVIDTRVAVNLCWSSEVEATPVAPASLVSVDGQCHADDVVAASGTIIEHRLTDDNLAEGVAVQPIR